MPLINLVLLHFHKYILYSYIVRLETDLWAHMAKLEFLQIFLKNYPIIAYKSAETSNIKIFTFYPDLLPHL